MAYARRRQVKKIVEIGPWGGRGGRAWDDGSHDGIREIIVVYGDCIDSITVVYDKHGTPFTAPKHGGVGGVKTAQCGSTFSLSYPDVSFTIGARCILFLPSFE
ncbi:unnamed protein product [Cuscuta campestris]|uniref:Jacalin-type lectin domain-containing protein n=1 Tax=Cuscuta campestris TaxID=132261 RepID=A0A484KQR4_9ASTE|nr:unnamed protein product [Cuscuta campestris]